MAACLVFAQVVNFADAQNTRRKTVKSKPYVATPAADITYERADTVVGADSIAAYVRLSGFRKTVTSRVESLMITNLSLTDTVCSLTVDVNYSAADGTQLHRREVTFNVVVPPGETRHTSVSSWDRQQLFYHVDTPPARKTDRSRPFTVTITPLRLLLHKQ